MPDNEIWVTVSDQNIRHIWRDRDDNETSVPPTFYENNGTPTAENGDDMEYVRTEVLAILAVSHTPAPEKPYEGDPTKRYVSAERMTHDDFGQPFTMAEGELVYDAATNLGPWATMTKASFDLHGRTELLGTGFGQCYRRHANGQLWKIEG